MSSLLASCIEDLQQQYYHNDDKKASQTNMQKQDEMSGALRHVLKLYGVSTIVNVNHNNFVPNLVS